MNCFHMGRVLNGLFFIIFAQILIDNVELSRTVKASQGKSIFSNQNIRSLWWACTNVNVIYMLIEG